jgi:glycerophosphoryl diester phosphodiesterase
MWIIGHRGAPRLAVENSLESLKIAMDEGADGVELDVQASGDGELVVVHDASLQRLAGVPLEVATTPWTTLRAQRLRSDGLAPQPIAHLDEVLQWCSGQPWRINFELKVARGAKTDDVVRLATRFARRVAAAWHPHWLVSSFSRAVLAQLQEASPQLHRAALVEQERDDWGPLLQSGLAPGSACQQVHAHHGLLDGTRLLRWQAAQWPVWAWTVNHPRDVEQAAQWAAAGLLQAIISDDPAGVRRRCERH